MYIKYHKKGFPRYAGAILELVHSFEIENEKLAVQVQSLEIKLSKAEDAQVAENESFVKCKEREYVCNKLGGRLELCQSFDLQKWLRKSLT